MKGASNEKYDPRWKIPNRIANDGHLLEGI